MAAKLTHESSWYTPASIKATLDLEGGEKTVRKEYTRLRDIAQKRLKRIEQAGFGESNIYEANVHRFKKLKEIKSKNELASRLSDLAHFIETPYSRVSKLKDQRAKSLKTLHSNGYLFVNEDNYLEFGKFMQAWRASKYNELYDSGDAADTYGITVKHQLDPKQVEQEFEFWLDNVEAAKKLRRSKQSIGNYDKMKTRVEKKAKKMEKENDS